MEALNTIALVDIHWSGKQLCLPDLSGIDLVLLGGDFTHFGGVDLARPLVERVQAAGPRVLAVCGNCDRPEIEEYLAQAGVALDRRALMISGVTLLGLSAGLPFGGCPYERSESDFRIASEEVFAAAAALPIAPQVLVCHQPPYGTRCDLARGRHVGSRALRSAIEREQPGLVICGHIHESAASDTIGNTRIINPGPCFRGRSLRFKIHNGTLTLPPEPDAKKCSGA